MSEWIKCSDRMPEVGTKVIAFRKGKKRNDGPFFAKTYNTLGRPWRFIDGERCDIGVTHWMPLPSPPEDSQ